MIWPLFVTYSSASASIHRLSDDLVLKLKQVLYTVAIKVDCHPLLTFRFVQLVFHSVPAVQCKYCPAGWGFDTLRTRASNAVQKGTVVKTSTFLMGMRVKAREAWHAVVYVICGPNQSQQTSDYSKCKSITITSVYNIR